MGTLYVEMRCWRPLARTLYSSYRTPDWDLLSVKFKFFNNSDVSLGNIIGPGAGISEVPLPLCFFPSFGGRARIKSLVPRPIA